MAIGINIIVLEITYIKKKTVGCDSYIKVESLVFAAIKPLNTGYIEKLVLDFPIDINIVNKNR